MKRWLVFICLATASMFIAGCVTTQNAHIGRQFAYGSPLERGRLNYKQDQYDQYIIEYQGQVSPDGKTYTIDGKFFKGAKSTVSDMWELKEITLTVYFLDAAKKTIQVEMFTVWPDQKISDGIAFKRTVAFNPESKFLNMGWRWSGRG